MKVTRQRFGEHDEVTIRGVRYHWLRRSGDGHVFERLETPFIVEAFSDERLAEEVGRPDYARRRDHLNPAKVEVRAASGLKGMRDLPEDERTTVAFRCDLVRRFLALSAEGRVNRTDEGAGRAIDIILADLDTRPGKDDAELRNESKPRIDTVLAERERERLQRLRRDMPCARTLLEWVRRYEQGEGASAALRDGRHRSGNTHARHGAEVRRHVSECADEFLSALRPEIERCHETLRIRLMHLNADRRRDGLPEVACPSIKFLSKEIRNRPAVHVHAAQHGAEQAAAHFSPLGEGLDVTWVGQRVEMDEWYVPVQAIFEEIGVWPVMTPKWQEAASKGRLWACTAIDTASRVPLGISLARTGGTLENALACLAMVVTDKTKLSEWAGAEMPWTMACVPDEVATDNGAGFRAKEFRNACEDLCARPSKMISGKSSMRGRAERLYRSAVIQLCSRLPGRTFANPVEKGDYDSEAHAVIIEEMLLKILIVHFVDTYCCRPHGGLGKQTPIDVYERLIEEYGINGDPGPHVRREVLGIDKICDLDRHGVRVFNLNWTSDELQAHFRQRGSYRVKVRLDPTDLGWVSIMVDGEWITCGCRREGMQGVSLVAWEASEADRNRRATSKAREREGVFLRSIEKIKAMVDGEMRRFGFGNRRLTTKDLDHIEKRMLDGFVSPERRDAYAEGPTLADAFDTAWPTGTAPLVLPDDSTSEEGGTAQDYGTPEEGGTPEDHSTPEDNGGPEDGDAVAGETGPPARARVAWKGTRVARKRTRMPNGAGAAGKSSKDSGGTNDGDHNDEAVRNDGQGEGDDDFTFERR